MEKKKRLEELDIVKGWGILLVCFRHINELTGLAALNLPLLVYLFSLFEAFMVMFFLLSGYVYSPKGTVLQDMGKKAKQLLLPMLEIGLVNTALYFVRYVVVEKRPLLWFIDNTVTNFAGLGNWNVRLWETQPNLMTYAFVPYWFVMELFTAFLLFIPLYRLIQKKPVGVRILTAALLLAAAMVCNYFDVQGSIANSYNSSVSFYFVLINIFGFSALLLTGKLLSEVELYRMEAHSFRFNAIFAAVCFGVDTVLLLFYLNNGYAMQYGKWGMGGPLGILETVLDGFTLTYFMVFLAYYNRRLPSAFRKALMFLGSNSQYLLLLHITIAETICWLGGWWQDVYHGPYPVEEFSLLHYLVTVAGTAVVLGVFFWARQKRKEK